ncbi:phosphotransferase [Candidatus Woesearchaeota archaeon]|nr:phosphotransferase [Candidatus Woesearchaeota archaeon]
MKLATIKKQIEKAVKLHAKNLGICAVKSVKVSKIGVGENNLNMLAEVNGKKFTFRISLKSEKNLSDEFRALHRIPKGLGPKPIYIDKTKRILSHEYIVMEYIEGRVLKRLSDKHLKLHAKSLAKLHSIRKKLPNGFDLNKWLKKEINWTAKRMPIYEDKEIQELLPKGIEYVKSKNHLFTALKQSSLTHCDPCLSNIIFNKKGLRYIDWEWSKFHDNAYDVSMIYDPDCTQPPWKMKLSGKRLKTYLNTYNRYMKDKTLMQRVPVWITVYRFTDLLFFKYKLWNWKNEKSKDIPKKQYEAHLRNTIKMLRKQFR